MPFAAAANAGDLSDKEAEQIQAIVAVLNAKNHYQVLNIDKDADENSIKSTYKKLALRLHPDKIRLTADQDKQKAERAFRAVQMAYETLSVPHSRKSYDIQLKMQSKQAQFVPGETGTAAEDSNDDDTSTGQFIVLLVQLVLACLLHIGLSLYQECKAFFTEQAAALHLSIISHIVLWQMLGWGFWSTSGLVLLVYSFSKMVPFPKLKQYLLLAIVLQLENWNNRAGMPFWAGLAIALDLWLRLEYDMLGAMFVGWMVGSTMFLGYVMPHMSFGRWAFWVAAGIGIACTYYFPVDIYAAIYVAILDWHFLQGLPAICLAVLACVLLFLAYKLSVGLLAFILALVLIFVEGSYIAVIVTTGLIAAVLMLWTYGWWASFYYLIAVSGARMSTNGTPMGKRMVLSTGLIWCLDCGWIWSIVLVVIIMIGGEVLSVAASQPIDNKEEPRRSEKAEHAGDGKDKKGKKKKK